MLSLEQKALRNLLVGDDEVVPTPPAAACRSARLVGLARKPQFNTESPTVRT